MNIYVTAGVPFFLPTFRIVKNNNFLEMESSFFYFKFRTILCLVVQNVDIPRKCWCLNVYRSKHLNTNVSFLRLLVKTLVGFHCHVTITKFPATLN